MASTNTLENEIKNLIARQMEKQSLRLDEQLTSFDHKLASLDHKLMSVQAEIREKKIENVQSNREQSIGIFNQGYLNDSRADREVSIGVNKSPKNNSKGQLDNGSLQLPNNDNQNYAEGLTIHGLSRIATGGPRSKIVWSLLIITSFINCHYYFKGTLGCILRPR